MRERVDIPGTSSHARKKSRRVSKWIKSSVSSPTRQEARSVSEWTYPARQTTSGSPKRERVDMPGTSSHARQETRSVSEWT